MRRTTVRWLLFGLALLGGGEASAQRTLYRCNANGQTVMSDRPCTGEAAAGLTGIGPERERRSTLALPTAVGKAADYLEYLSPLCAELNEGMRNGPARGLGPRALLELHQSYRERCGEEDQAARKRFAEAQQKRREARNDELVAEKRERDQARLTREQCDEMYRIVHGRRKKLDTMTTGERADFERFEANWKSRCVPT